MVHDSLKASMVAAAALRQQFLAGLALYGALALAYAIYAPALTGFFLFDDFPNLAPLAVIQADHTLDEILLFILHGVSSPTGRPLSLATFAAQAFDWPLHPEGFLRVNLWLHLLNGALLFTVLLRLTRLLGWPAARSLWQSLAVTALWLVAPLQVTAVIYVIQRMTELSATFCFLGLLVYLAGRQRSALEPGTSAGLGLMTAGVAIGGFVGMFAKENAVLFPLLVLVLESTLLAGLPKPAKWRAWAGVVLVLPTLALAAGLLASPWVFAHTYGLREFGAAERLMTEGRVVVMYLYKLLLPWPSAVRLLYDDLPISRALWDPWSTLASAVAIAALVISALKLRLRWPLYAFAVLWFLGAHVLESTTIPLELVFEHRNYQASVGIWFALVAAVPAVWARLPRQRIRVVLCAAAAMYLLLLCSVTLQITTLWGRPLLMADWWSQKLPESKRAKIEYLAALIGYRLPEVAETVVKDAIVKWPDHPAFYLLQIRIHCQFPDVVELPPAAPIAERMRRMSTEQFTAFHLIDSALKYVEEGGCPALKPAMITEIVEAGFENPTLRGQRRNLLLLYSRALMKEGRVIEALDRIREAVEVHPLIELIVQGLVLELDAGRIDRAREYLAMAESDPRVSFMDRWSHRKNLRALRELMAQYDPPPAPAPAEPRSP